MFPNTPFPLIRSEYCQLLMNITTQGWCQEFKVEGLDLTALIDLNNERLKNALKCTTIYYTL